MLRANRIRLFSFVARKATERNAVTFLNEKQRWFRYNSIRLTSNVTSLRSSLRNESSLTRLLWFFVFFINNLPDIVVDYYVISGELLLNYYKERLYGYDEAIL